MTTKADQLLVSALQQLKIEDKSSEEKFKSIFTDDPREYNLL